MERYRVNVASFEDGKRLAEELNKIDGVNARYGLNVMVDILDPEKLELVRKVCLQDHNGLTFAHQILPK